MEKSRIKTYLFIKKEDNPIPSYFRDTFEFMTDKEFSEFRHIPVEDIETFIKNFNRTWDVLLLAFEIDRSYCLIISDIVYVD